MMKGLNLIVVPGPEIQKHCCQRRISPGERDMCGWVQWKRTYCSSFTLLALHTVQVTGKGGIVSQGPGRSWQILAGHR